MTSFGFPQVRILSRRLSRYSLSLSLRPSYTCHSRCSVKVKVYYGQVVRTHSESQIVSSLGDTATTCLSYYHHCLSSLLSFSFPHSHHLSVGPLCPLRPTVPVLPTSICIPFPRPWLDSGNLLGCYASWCTQPISEEHESLLHTNHGRGTH